METSLLRKNEPFSKFAYPFQNSTPTLIIKMPLPFKNKIVCSDDMRFILSPNNNGVLDVYKIDSGSQESIESGGLQGKPSIIRSSCNGYVDPALD